MTARDAMLPCRHQIRRRRHATIHRILAVARVDGHHRRPALAAMLISFVGGVESLWFTAAMSLSAAIVTCTIPRKSARFPTPGHLSAHESAGLVKESLGALRRGLHVLFRSDGILTASVSLSLGIVMILGSFQGLVLPVFFTELGEPALLGFTLSAMSAGMLAGSLVYAALTHKIKRRTWYVASFVGMGAGVAIIGLFPPYPIMLAGLRAARLRSRPCVGLARVLHARPRA